MLIYPIRLSNYPYFTLLYYSLNTTPYPQTKKPIMVHGKAEVEYLGRPLTTLTLLLSLWVSCYVLGSFCPSLRAGAAGKTKKAKTRAAIPTSQDHRTQFPRNSEWKIYIYIDSDQPKAS